jgi:hypothetical protein
MVIGPGIGIESATTKYYLAFLLVTAMLGLFCDARLDLRT